MIRDEAKIREITDRALAAGVSGEVEVAVDDQWSALTRFANNQITQNLESSRLSVSVRVLKGRQVGRATTGSDEPGAITAAVEQAAALAAACPDDPEALPLPDPAPLTVPERYDPAVAASTPKERADAVAAAVAACRREKMSGSGIYEVKAEASALANSRGQFVWARSSEANFSLSAAAGDAAGWSGETAGAIAGLDPAGVTRRAVAKAVASREPGELPPGEYPVVFEPAAVADFLLFAAWESLGALPFLEGRSPFSGKLGRQVLGENITIRDDIGHPLAIGQPFDSEGLPRQAVTLVERGTVKAVVHDRATARRAGAASTGHALPQPNPHGPLPLNLVLDGGDSSQEEMIAGTERGLLVTRVHYPNLIDPMKLTVTGMTRDGTFLIERGKVVRPVRNLRFTESLLDVFNRVEALSREQVLAPGFWLGSVVPGLKVSRFRFTSETEF